MQYIATGLAGLQGPFYGGTNCFHRRKVIYGLSPDEVEMGTIVTSSYIYPSFIFDIYYMLIQKNISK